MRITSIEDVRNIRDALNEQYVVTTLSNISLAPQLGEATVNGIEHKLSKRAVHQLCQMLGVPFNFAKTLSEKMPDVWKHLTNRLVYESSKLVTVKINGHPPKILAFFVPKEDHMSLKRFLKIVDTVYKSISDFSGVENMVVDLNHESATAFFYTPKEFNPILGDITDIFRYGVGFSASSLEMYSPTVTESIFRLVCSNMTFTPAYGGMRFKSRNEERILNAVGVILEDPDRVSRYSDILNALTEQMLSVREVEDMYNTIDRIKDSEGNTLVQDLNKRFPLKRIAKAYGYEYFENLPNSPSWKATAKTPVTAYEAVNQATEIGSHYTHISEKTRLDLLIYAGQMMFKKKWDLSEIAPQDVEFRDSEVR